MTGPPRSSFRISSPPRQLLFWWCSSHFTSIDTMARRPGTERCAPSLVRRRPSTPPVTARPRSTTRCLPAGKRTDEYCAQPDGRLFTWKPSRGIALTDRRYSMCNPVRPHQKLPVGMRQRDSDEPRVFTEKFVTIRAGVSRETRSKSQLRSQRCTPTFLTCRQ